MSLREILLKIAAISERLDKSLAEVERAEFQSARIEPGESGSQPRLVANHVRVRGRKRRAILRVTSFIVSSMLVGLVIPLCYVNHSESTYCDRCGLVKGERSTSVFGLTIWWSESRRETTFDRLYRRYLSTECRHYWVWCGGSSRSLAGGAEFGCGRRPWVLQRATEDSLRALELLHDRSRIAAVLSSFDLSPEFGSSAAIAQSERDDALMELHENSSREEVERWWRQYRRLFVGQAKESR